MAWWTRRNVLAAAPSLAFGRSLQDAAPVRSTPLRARHFGPLFYDESEWNFLAEVFADKAPFRFWGLNPAKTPDKVSTFEREFAAWMKVKYALAVTSGTAALQVAMAAMGVGPGDEVIVPAWTWHSCFNAVVMAGALPVCAEIDESFNLDPALVERHITPRTKVLMAVHLQGCPADMDALMAIAKKHKLLLLEDVSQAVGASYKGRPLGSMGDLAIASLQVNKTISAGEGGAVYTNNPAMFDRAVRFHDTGTVRAPHAEWLGDTKGPAFIGVNFRMNEFTGAVLLAQIRKLDKIAAKVRAAAKQVYDGVADLPGIELRKRPDPAGDLGSTVQIGFPEKRRRDLFLELMKKENVPGSGPSGSVILPLQEHIIAKRAAHPNWPTWNSPEGKAVRYGPEACPRTIAVLNRFGGVAIDPSYGPAEARDIVTAIRKVYPVVMAS